MNNPPARRKKARPSASHRIAGLRVWHLVLAEVSILNSYIKLGLRPRKGSLEGLKTLKIHVYNDSWSSRKCWPPLEQLLELQTQNYDIIIIMTHCVSEEKFAPIELDHLLDRQHSFIEFYHSCIMYSRVFSLFKVFLKYFIKFPQKSWYPLDWNTHWLDGQPIWDGVFSVQVRH